jgi:hypothetical protein
MDGENYWTSNIALMTEKRYGDERFLRARFIIWVEKNLMTKIKSILKLSVDYKIGPRGTTNTTEWGYT